MLSNDNRSLLNGTAPPHGLPLHYHSTGTLHHDAIVAATTDPSNSTTTTTTAPIASSSSNNLVEAADLIREIDDKYCEMNASAAMAAQDAEEARKNARAAQALIRLYTTTGGSAASGTTAAAAASAISSLWVISPALQSAGGGFAGQEPSSNSSSPRRMPPPPPPPPPRSGTATSTNLRTPMREDTTYSTSPLDITTSASYDSTFTGAGGGGSSMTSRRGRITPTIVTSTERLAAAHAEDVLAISLELERVRKNLENEQVTHEDTKAALEQSEERNAKLQQQLDNLLNELETQRQSHGLQVDALEQDLQRAQQRTRAAEEDAQLALDLAKGSAESRENVEGWLERALNEIDMLRAHILSLDKNAVLHTPSGSDNNSNNKNQVTTKKTPSSQQRVVRFADEALVLNEKEQELAQTPSRPPRGLVAAGRQLLHRNSESSRDESKIHVVSFNSSDSSVDRRRRLRCVLSPPIGSTIQDTLPKPPSPARALIPKIDVNVTVQALECCRKVTEILLASGQRLLLSGRWWNGETTKDVLQLEALARHYCVSVEV